MRPDMGRVIIEVGRSSGGGKGTCYDKIRRVGEEFENLPAFESSSRHRKQGGKAQGDRLAPLRRFLRANVGRPWSKVFSEICEVNDLRTIRGYHLRSHLKFEVDVKPDPRPYYDSPFFVDKYGILKHRQPKRASFLSAYSWDSKTRTWRIKEEPNPTVKINANSWYERIEGLWYRFEKSEKSYSTPVWPAQIIERSDGQLEVVTKTQMKEVVKKIACGKKELKKIQELLAVQS